jgi:hypothetical protein
VIACAERLRDEPSGAHPQKTESPEDKVEEQPSKRHTAQVGCAAEVTRNRGIDRAENWLREVRENDRKCERQNPPVPATLSGKGEAGAQPRSCTQTQGETTTAHNSGLRAA